MADSPITSSSLPDHLKTLLTQYPLPHHWLTQLMYILTRARWPAWKKWQIRWFIKRYQVDMGIALESDPLAYPDFNTFFTRALKPGARPIVHGPGEIACPVDGAVSQAGDIVDGRIFQAKGHDYSLETLLGGSPERAALFAGGRYATIYLSPKDYHRIHMPLTGRLQEMAYIPGRLFSVNPRTTRYVPGLFARNERLVTIFDTPAGPMALILVGALFVAGIETVWAGLINPHPSTTPQTWNYRDSPITLEHGAEMGRFNMGSTVIVLFGADCVDLASTLQPDAPVNMGQLMGTFDPAAGRF
ncbi:MAG: phosphatidylserine decarboxylase [Gammaproteobacteria bacterium]|nr:phosphatidylserine decarboxylase [Gammaproteobacteria bacterium]